MKAYFWSCSVWSVSELDCSLNPNEFLRYRSLGTGLCIPSNILPLVFYCFRNESEQLQQVPVNEVLEDAGC